MTSTRALTFIFFFLAAYGRSCRAQCAALGATAETARRAVQIDMTAINSMKNGFTLNSSVLDDWAKMTDDQKRKLYQVAVFNLIHAAASVPFVPIRAGGVNLPSGIASLGTGQANALKSTLQANGVDDPILMNLISGAAKVTGKPAAAEAGLKILDHLSTLTQTGIGLAGESKAEAIAPVAQFGLILMGRAYAGYAAALGAGSDTLTLIQAGAEGLEARQQVGQLTNRNEVALSKLKTQMAKLQSDVATLRDAKIAVNTCQNASATVALPIQGRSANDYASKRQALTDQAQRDMDAMTRCDRAFPACSSTCNPSSDINQWSSCMSSCNSAQVNCRAPFQKDFDECIRARDYLDAKTHYGSDN
jgi:hypothetical protein